MGNLGLLVSLEASRPTYWGVWGAEPPRKKGSYILHVSVVAQILILMTRTKVKRTLCRAWPSLVFSTALNVFAYLSYQP